MKHITRRFYWQFLALLGGALLLAIPGLPVFAINYGSGTYGGCQYGSCSITIASGNAVSVDVTPTASGSCTVQKDSVSVQTTNSSGYTLTMANSSTNTSLLKGAATISSSSASQASPAALTANTWGYRVDSVGGFGAGPTSAQSNISIGSTKFAGVPASNSSPATIASTNTPANPAVITSVWYGVCANTNVVNGTYTTQVTYTAVAN